jgi:hypothetical protein
MHAAAADADAIQPLHFYAPPGVVHKKLWLVSAAMGPVVLISPMIGGKQAGPVFLFALGLWLVCLALIWALMRYPRLTISADGVYFRAVGYSIDAPWDNIIAITTQPLIREGTVDGLALRESGFRSNDFLIFFSMFSYAASMQVSQQQHFLPISSLLGDSWWYTGFGNALRERAPHLFDA